jgi:hypothetical protein
VSWIRLLRSEGDQDNRLRISLPRDTPFALEGSIRRGESRVRLGGLSVASVDLELVQGEHAVGFDIPAPRPLESFAVDASQGSFSFTGLGNASPATVDVGGSMGELLVDLGGAWRNDADVRGRWRMGEVRVGVPAGVRTEVGEIDVFLGGSDTSGLRGADEPGEEAPKLTLSFSGSLGEIVITR